MEKVELKDVPCLGDCRDSPQTKARKTTDDDMSTQIPLKRNGVSNILKSPERKWSAALASLVAALLGFVLGITLGYPSNIILDLTGEATELPSEFYFSTISLSIFTALGPVGALPGGPLGGFIADRWGRKCSMMLCGLPFLIGYLLLSYAHYSSSVGVFNGVLFSGRFLTGIGMGWTVAVPTVYISEISSTTFRGIYGNVFVLLLNIGLLLNYGLGAIDNFRYYYISLVAIGFVAVYQVLMFWLPETPRWLLAKELSLKKKKKKKGQRLEATNKLTEENVNDREANLCHHAGPVIPESQESCIESESIAGEERSNVVTPEPVYNVAKSSKSTPSEAEKVLLWLRGKKVGIETELEEMKKAISTNSGHGWKSLDKKLLTKRMIIVVVIFILQPMGGINYTAPFAGTILSEAGFSNPRIAAIYAVGGAAVVGLVVSMFLINLLGRKTLLIISAIGQFLGILLLGIHSFTTRSSLCSPTPTTTTTNLTQYNLSTTFNEEEAGVYDDDNIVVCNSHLKYLALSGMLISVLLFNVGFNSVPLVLFPELIPLPVRGITGGIASVTTLGCTAIFSGFYYTVAGWITPWVTLWGVALLDISAAVFVFVFVPETKGKSLDEFGERPRQKSV